MSTPGLLLPGLLAALLLASCEPDPVRMELLAYDRESDAYGFRNVELETITDLDSLEGKAARLLVHAAVTLNYIDGTLTWKQNPRKVSFAWHQDGELVVPEDFDSFSMASIYYNLELASSFFEDLGLDEATLGQIPAYYNSTFKIIYQDGTRETWKDNALFVALTAQQNAFFIVPFEFFEWVPLALNSGIMTHEYTHAVFNELVFDANPILARTDSVPTANFISSINEGLADFMAVAETGDPDFITHSIPKGVFKVEGNNGLTEIARDASELLTYTAAMDDEARTILSTTYVPYAMGAFLAAYLYAVAVSVDGLEPKELPSIDTLRRIAALVLETMRELGQTAGDTFDMADALSLFVGRCINPEDRAIACEVASERASLIFNSIDGC